MYINQIDDLLGKLLDDFYVRVISTSQISTIIKESNFVKHHKHINDIMLNYTNSIDLNDIKKTILLDKNVKFIIETFKRYIAYYLFITIGILYKGKDDVFDNNIVEITKNQSEQKYKIQNFYTSESTSNIIKFTKLAKKIQNVVDLDKSKLSSLSTKEEYSQTFEFLNQLGNDFVISTFKLSSVKNNVSMQWHNIIKTMLIIMLYTNIEKKDILQIVESSELDSGEYIFIDIVVPTKKYIDLSDIESALSQKEIDDGVALNIWTLITKSHEILNMSQELPKDEKILSLMNKKLIVPIVEDFLLYHKDTEKYDKTMDAKVKKKEDTRIKYIVNKIDTFSNYYSENAKKNKTTLDDIKKLLYVPMANKMAILVNNTEEIKIINKLMMYGKKNLESNEFYNDLVLYRKYPYVNFKDFNNAGFTISCDNTINVIRSTSFGPNINPNNTLQLRIGSRDQILHVVGFMIPSNAQAIECVKMRGTNDIRTSNKTEKINGFNKFIDLLQKYVSNPKIKHNSTYWLFNPELDKIKSETYEQIEKLTVAEYCKHMTSTLYDTLLQIMYVTLTNIFNKIKPLTIQKAFSILSHFEKHFIEIPKHSKIYKNLEKSIYYELCKTVDDTYDSKNDLMFGIYGDVVLLHASITPTPSDILVVNVNLATEQRKKIKETAEESINAICQHYVSWDQLALKKKTSIMDFENDKYTFMQTYVIENFEQEYICKSCGALLNIKKFVADGVFDDTTQHFVAFGSPINIPLEEIQEYEKYSVAIRNMDRMIEKISSISNIPYFVGSTLPLKWRRRSVTKDAIDMIIQHNKILSKDHQKRNDVALRKYGIDKDFTDFFVFEFDNSIFKFSSQEKDFYKHIKYNNILIYVVIYMIMELNESHVTFMSGDKICNFYSFNKFGKTIFNDLKIIVNNKKDVEPILNYPILCYMLYIMSYEMLKYNIWYHEKDTTKKQKKFDPSVQKIVVYTFVDILNSILETYESHKKMAIYEILFVKYNQKRVNIFANNDIIIRLTHDDVKTGVYINKNLPATTKYEPFNITKGFHIRKLDSVTYNKVFPAKIKPPIKSYTPPTINKITSYTNCISGTFHKWTISGNILKCSLCGVTHETIKSNDPLDKEIYDKAINITLNELAKIYCADGNTHVFEIIDDKKICKLCKYEINTKISDKQLTLLEQSFYKNTILYDEFQIKINEYHQKINKYYDKMVGYLKSNYGETKVHKEDYYKFIDTFVKYLQSITGDNVLINNVIFHLKDDMYIIDHDHLGFPLEKPIYILDQNNKIQYKNNHTFFKTDVLYYTNYKIGKVDVYYDVKTLMLLGYKELNKDYVIVNKPDKRIKIEYSIFNKIKYLGNEHKYVNISHMIDNLTHIIDPKNVDSLLRTAVSQLCRNRNTNLANIIYKFQIYINMIKNEIMQHKESPDDIIFDISNYTQKLKNMSFYDDKHKHKVFKLWFAITSKLHFKPLGDKVINIDPKDISVDMETIHKYDYHSNLLLFYIITEMTKLLNYNKNKIVKQNLAVFLIDFINNMYRDYNNDLTLKNLTIQRFAYELKSSTYYRYLEKTGYGMEEFTTGIYSEYNDPSDPISKETRHANEEAIEEMEALDIDGKLDYEDEYASRYDSWERDIPAFQRYAISALS